MYRWLKSRNFAFFWSLYSASFFTAISWRRISKLSRFLQSFFWRRNLSREFCHHAWWPHFPTKYFFLFNLIACWPLTFLHTTVQCFPCTKTLLFFVASFEFSKTVLGWPFIHDKKRRVGKLSQILWQASHAFDMSSFDGKGDDDEKKRGFEISKCTSFSHTLNSTRTVFALKCNSMPQ